MRIQRKEGGYRGKNEDTEERRRNTVDGMKAKENMRLVE